MSDVRHSTDRFRVEEDRGLGRGRKVRFPGVIVPAFVTAPVTVELVITIEVMDCPAAFVTVATVWLLTLCPAPGPPSAPVGNAKRSAATEVVAKREEMGSREAANGRAGIERNGKETPFLA